MLIPWPNRSRTAATSSRADDISCRSRSRSIQTRSTDSSVGRVAGPGARATPRRARVRAPCTARISVLARARDRVRVSTSGLTVRTTATNIEAEGCPYGSGAHPYLTLGTNTVDDFVLQVRRGRRCVRRSRHPDRHGRRRGHGARLPPPRRIGQAKLDNGYTDLERDDAGVARVVAEGPAGSARTLWVDRSYPYVMVFTGDISSVERRALAIEPMTCPPNAFRSGEALVTLEPGESHTATWGLSPTIGVRT